jgi:hypothetical protein
MQLFQALLAGSASLSLQSLIFTFDVWLPLLLLPLLLLLL